MLEREMAEIVTKYPQDVFPDLDFDFVDRERSLGDGCRYDLRFREREGNDWIVELKRDAVTACVVEQLDRYLKRCVELDPGVSVRGMAVAPKVSAAARAAADASGIVCRSVSEARLREIARTRGMHIGPTVVARLEHSRTPGVWKVSARFDRLRAYWDSATPDAPTTYRQLAARLTDAALDAVPGSTLSTRSIGKRDPYTTVRTSTDRVMAAIDARSTYVKFDFYLPFETAERMKRQGLLRTWKPRGRSVWCQSRVGDRLSFESARTLLREGVAFEFGVAG